MVVVLVGGVVWLCVRLSGWQNVDMSPLWGVCIIHPGVRRFYIQVGGATQP